MTPADRLRLLMSPHKERWKLMLVGLALAAGAIGAAALQSSKVIEAILILVALAAWFIGACGMVGYMRWFFATELARAKQDALKEAEKEKNESGR